MIRPSTAVRTNLRYLVPICLAATLGGLLFGYDTGVISGALGPIQARFALSPAMTGWASGCVLLGCAAGVLAAGPLSDRRGRKAALALAAVMFLLSAAGSAWAPAILSFVLFRLVGGLGIGIASIATPMYVAEITPAGLRGRMVAANQIAIVAGIAATALVNYLIARGAGQAWLIASGWRWMFATGVAPAAVFAAALWRIPESPRWLIEAGRNDEAVRVLRRVGGEEFAAAEERTIRAAIAEETGTWRELLSPRLHRPLAVGIALAILQQVTGINVFMYFGATIFRNLSASTGLDAGLLQQIIINGSGVVFTLAAIATVDKWGRKPLMILGAAGMGVSLLAMGLLAQRHHTQGTGLMLGFILCYIACFGLSVGPVTWVILAEIFPNAVRGRAFGLAALFLWLSDFAVTQTFPILDAPDSWLVARFHHAFPFYLYAGCCALLVILVLKAVPETRGRTLEEISRDCFRC